MTEHTGPSHDVSEVLDAARAAQEAVQQLCRATLARPDMTPAQVDTVLAHLTRAVAALPRPHANSATSSSTPAMITPSRWMP